MPDSAIIIEPLQHLARPLGMVDKCLEDMFTTVLEIMPVAECGPIKSGKRIRPALVLLSAELFGAIPEQAIQVAAAVEAIHWASLLHDDVVDSTTVRRGERTLNCLEGNKLAILVGDYLLTQATDTIYGLNQPKLLGVLNAAAAKMTMGQLLELRCQGDIAIDEATYMRIIDGKTASLMSASCHLGAVIAGASPEHCQSLANYGHSIGLAFQIADDMLDFWGEADALGKPILCDVSENKYTLPLLLALKLASAEQKQQLINILSEKRFSDKDCQAILDILAAVEARKKAMQVAKAQVTAALSHLENLPQGAANQALAQLPDYLLKRDR